MSSKLIHGQKDFFTKLCVDAVLHLDQEDLNELYEEDPDGDLDI